MAFSTSFVDANFLGPINAHGDNGILTIRLNRPRVLNAIDLAMAEQLSEQLFRAAENQAIRAVIITGTGRAFCAGGDLKFAHQINPQSPGDAFLTLTSILHDCIETIRKMDKPVIATIKPEPVYSWR